MTIDLYGIPNCDTVRKARKWLADQGIDYTFYNYKKEAPELDFLRQAADAIGWDTLINRRGTSWRRLDAADRADLDSDKALRLMVANPSLIKRPLLLIDGRPVRVGFDPDAYATLLK